MNSPAVDIKDMLVAAGLGAFGITLHVASMPDTPDLCIAVYDIAGLSAELNYDWGRPAVQVQVRGKAGVYTDAYNKLKAISDLLHGKQETRGSSIYKLIQQEGDISHVSTDELRRPLLTTRFQIQRTAA